jgi:hypothetical protein
MTKQGGLTLHAVPLSYPHHENDGYRLSHLTLTTLLEERGFAVLDAGYDIYLYTIKVATSDDETNRST